MRSLILSSALTGLAILSACNQHDTESTAATSTSFSLDSVRSQIQASNAVYGESFGKKDSAAFVACYTNDACINPTGMPRMCGQAAIVSFFNEGIKMGVHNVKLSIDEVMGGPEAVVETGKYEVLGADGTSFEKGKYMVMWKQENGKWKMHRDQWNSDMPPPVAPK